MKKPVVLLTPVEMAMALAVVASQAQHVIENNRPVTNGAEREGILHRGITGVLGEMGFAKWKGFYYAPAPFKDRKRGDVRGYEVRGVPWEQWRVQQGKEQRHLFVYEEDADDRPFVLAVVKFPKVQLAGWMLGKDAKRAEWLKDPQARGHGLYYVPHLELLEMKDLPIIGKGTT